ncbi:hypothetical protein AXF42_Ash005434 [Apostasia shenzhenica]|uniref:Uncharacterized protein n=1 Tax=Apostasia shenzhenica TaxID=1088818 RepID=A0A2I0B6W7_9ASPA|nr:hypothetical protein AXF42_Ash005434 [Apostasia shenzhenica]
MGSTTSRWWMETSGAMGWAARTRRGDAGVNANRQQRLWRERRFLGGSDDRRQLFPRIRRPRRSGRPAGSSWNAGHGALQSRVGVGRRFRFPFALADLNGIPSPASPYSPAAAVSGPTVASLSQVRICSHRLRRRLLRALPLRPFSAAFSSPSAPPAKLRVELGHPPPPPLASTSAAAAAASSASPPPPPSPTSISRPISAGRRRPAAIDHRRRKFLGFLLLSGVGEAPVSPIFPDLFLF